MRKKYLYNTHTHTQLSPMLHNSIFSLYIFTYQFDSLFFVYSAVSLFVFIFFSIFRCAPIMAILGSSGLLVQPLHGWYQERGGWKKSHQVQLSLLSLSDSLSLLPSLCVLLASHWLISKKKSSISLIESMLLWGSGSGWYFCR